MMGRGYESEMGWKRKGRSGGGTRGRQGEGVEKDEEVVEEEGEEGRWYKRNERMGGGLEEGEGVEKDGEVVEERGKEGRKGGGRRESEGWEKG